jgi:hypothetical protein
MSTTRRDVLSWFVIVTVIVLVQRLTSSNGWGNDIWLGVIAASLAVGLSVLARNRGPGR